MKQTGCGFEPRHAFVFYNGDDAPVAEMQVYVGCGRWDLSGANEGVTDMPIGALKRVEDLLKSLQLPDLALDIAESDEEAFRDAYLSWKHSGALQRPSDMFKIPKARKLSEMSDIEKQQLCAWRIAEIASGHFANNRLGWTIDGVGAFWLRDFDECVFRFPNCDRTLGEVERIDLRRDHDYAFAQTKACIVKWIFGPDGNCLGVSIDSSARHVAGQLSCLHLTRACRSISCHRSSLKRQSLPKRLGWPSRRNCKIVILSADTIPFQTGTGCRPPELAEPVERTSSVATEM